MGLRYFSPIQIFEDVINQARYLKVLLLLLHRGTSSYGPYGKFLVLHLATSVAYMIDNTVDKQNLPVNPMKECYSDMAVAANDHTLLHTKVPPLRVLA